MKKVRKIVLVIFLILFVILFLSNSVYALDDISEVYTCPRELRPIIWFLKKAVFNTIQLFVPILLIVMGTVDFAKAVASIDDKGNKEAISKFIKRCLAALIVFFVGTIVSLVMDMFSSTKVGEQTDWKACWQDIE